MNLNAWERASAVLALLAIVVMLGAAWVVGGKVAPYGPAADVEPVQDPVPRRTMQDVADVVGVPRKTADEWVGEKRKSAEFATPPDSRQHFDGRRTYWVGAWCHE